MKHSADEPHYTEKRGREILIEDEKDKDGQIDRQMEKNFSGTELNRKRTKEMKRKDNDKSEQKK